MSAARLDEIAALLAAATPGPWRWVDTPDAMNSAEYGSYSGHLLASVPDGIIMDVSITYPTGTAGSPDVAIDVDDANAALIAAAPTVVAELLDEVRRLRLLTEPLGVRLAIEAAQRGGAILDEMHVDPATAEWMHEHQEQTR